MTSRKPEAVIKCLVETCNISRPRASFDFYSTWGFFQSCPRSEPRVCKGFEQRGSGNLLRANRMLVSAIVSCSLRIKLIPSG